MVRSGKNGKLAQRRVSERTRGRPAARGVQSLPTEPGPTTIRGAQAFLRRQAATACGWCGAPIPLKAKGRIPKWCSAACRQRAWEQSRAAASGRSAVQIVERHVDVVVKPSPPPPATPQHQDWLPLLLELAIQLDNGALYDRDLPALTKSVNHVLGVFARRRRRRPARR